MSIWDVELKVTNELTDVLALSGDIFPCTLYIVFERLAK